MQKLKLGFNEDISNEDYHNDREFISSSGLKMVLTDPRKFYRTYILNEEEDKLNKDALDFGSYLHALILEPHLVETEFAIFDGIQRRGKKWDDFALENGDKIIVTKGQDYQAQQLMQNFKQTTVIVGKHGFEKEVPIASFYDDGYPEQTLCGEIEGVKIKVRFDYRKEFETFGSINDLKTTSAYIGTPECAEKVCASFSYDISAALYCDLAEQITGKPHDFYFCFLSKKDGLVKMYRASEQMLEEGRKKYMEAIRRLKYARETGIYYTNRIEEINSISKE